MDIEIYKSKIVYEIWINEEFEVTVEVEDDKINIVRIKQYIIDEHDFEHEYYAKVKYTKKIVDINNLENEMKVFVGSRFEKMINKLEEIKAKLNTYNN